MLKLTTFFCLFLSFGALAQEGLFHVKSRSANGIRNGDLVLIDQMPVGEVVGVKLDRDNDIFISFRLWERYGDALKDSMIVFIKRKPTSSRLHFVSRKGKKPGQSMRPGSVFFAAGRWQYLQRKYLGNPTRALAKGLSRSSGENTD